MNLEHAVHTITERGLTDRQARFLEGTIASWPSAPSSIEMVTTAVHGRSSPGHMPWLRTLTAGDTCAAVRVCIGRRLVPAGPPTEDRKEGREGRERPGLPRAWAVPGPASRVAHAPCLWSDCPDKRGPHPYPLRSPFRCQICVTIAPAAVSPTCASAACVTLSNRWSFSAAPRSCCSGSSSSTMHLRSDQRRDWATGMEICFGWATVTRCCSSASGLGFQC